MLIDNYCLCLFLLVLFLLYLDNKNNLEGYAELSELAEISGDGTAGLGVFPNGKGGKQEEPKQEEPKQKYVPIGLKPQKLKMAPPMSMSDSMGMLSGAPANMENYMLLPTDMGMGIRTIDSKLPVPYPRVGGTGNLGGDLGGDLGGGSVPAQVPDQGQAPVRDKKEPVPAQSLDKPPQGANELKAVIIYAPWCGWSKKSLPDFEKMDDTLNSTQAHQTNNWNVSCEVYNSETPEGKAKAKEYDVKGFPAVFIEENGKREEGPRSHDEMIQVINKKTGGNIQA